MMLYSTGHKFGISVTNIIVIITFLWSNLVWAGGVPDRSTLAPSSNLPVLYKDAAVDMISLDVLRTLDSEDVGNIKVFYEREIEEEIRKRTGDVRCFGIRDMDGKKGKWAFYIVDLRRMELVRYVSVEDVNDRFFDVLNSIELLSVGTEGYKKKVYRITNRIKPFIEKCVERLYVYPVKKDVSFKDANEVIEEIDKMCEERYGRVIDRRKVLQAFPTLLGIHTEGSEDERAEQNRRIVEEIKDAITTEFLESIVELLGVEGAFSVIHRSRYATLAVAIANLVKGKVDDILGISSFGKMSRGMGDFLKDYPLYVEAKEGMKLLQRQRISIDIPRKETYSVLDVGCAPRNNGSPCLGLVKGFVADNVGKDNVEFYGVDIAFPKYRYDPKNERIFRESPYKFDEDGMAYFNGVFYFNAKMNERYDILNDRFCADKKYDFVINANFFVWLASEIYGEREKKAITVDGLPVVKEDGSPQYYFMNDIQERAFGNLLRMLNEDGILFFHPWGCESGDEKGLNNNTIFQIIQKKGDRFIVMDRVISFEREIGHVKTRMKHTLDGKIVVGRSKAFINPGLFVIYPYLSQEIREKLAVLIEEIYINIYRVETSDNTIEGYYAEMVEAIRNHRSIPEIIECLLKPFPEWYKEDVRDRLNNIFGEAINSLESGSIGNRIRGLWRVRDVYFGLESGDTVRMEALELIFKVLEDREDEDLWKNAREILTEMLESPDEGIWRPAFERSIKSLRDKEEIKNSWRAVLEAIMPVRGKKENEEIDKGLMELLGDTDRDVRLGVVLILRELKPVMVDVLEVLNKRMAVEEDIEVKKTMVEAYRILSGKPLYEGEFRWDVTKKSVAGGAKDTTLQYCDSNGTLKKEFEYKGPFSLSKVQINPISMYQSRITGEKILIKGGNEYTLWADYIGLRFFRLYGLPAPDASLVKIDGKLYIAIEYLEDYEEFRFSLPEPVRQDRRIMDGVLLSIMLGDNDRKPGNIIWKDSDIFHIDFGASLFSRATGGFVPFSPHLDMAELDRVLNVVRLGQKAMANEAYGEAMKDPGLLSELARRVGAITNAQIRDIVRSSGMPYGEESLRLVDTWIEQLTVEGEPGNWNRKPRSRFVEPLETFGLMKEYGGLGEYVEQALINRRNDIVRIFGKFHHIDLHYHTTASDGLKSPAEVMREAKERGLLGIGIIGHNTFSGLEEAARAGDELGVSVIPGVEIDACDDSLGIDNFHLLVYFPQERIPEILNSDFPVVEEIRQFFREDRDKGFEIIRRFNDYYKKDGLEITGDDIKKLPDLPNIYRIGQVIFEKYGSERLGVKDYRRATKRYIRNNPNVYLSGGRSIPVSKVFTLSQRFGGVVVLAHPFEMLDLDKIRRLLVKYHGIQGIELYSSKHSRDKIDALKGLIAELGRDYLITPGSDGHNERDRGLEMAIGQVSEEFPNGNIPYEAANYRIVEDLKGRFNKPVVDYPEPEITGKRVAVIGAGNAGIGYGGSCFPKDVDWIVNFANRFGIESIARATQSNIKTVLVTGGAGFIGSFVTRKLKQEGYKVIVLDNLINGHRGAVPDGAIFIQGDIGDEDLLNEVFGKYQIDAVMHFAGSVNVRESKEKPARYFYNNLINTLKLLDAMQAHNVKMIVFSSTAAVYGDQDVEILTEDSPLRPNNPYGTSKFFVEKILGSQGINAVSLRYFNAAGADNDGLIGEDHHPETHLIPTVFEVVLGKRDSIGVHPKGMYPTPDGSAVRDYIHVEDLANAHVMAMRYLEKFPGVEVFNLGTGRGFSVRRIISEIEELLNIKIPAKDRKGQGPAKLVASFEKARRILGWNPTMSLPDIIRSAWAWHRKNPDGYGDLPQETKIEEDELEIIAKIIEALNANEKIDKDMKFNIFFNLLLFIVDKYMPGSEFAKTARDKLSIQLDSLRNILKTDNELIDLFITDMNSITDIEGLLICAILVLQFDLDGYENCGRETIRNISGRLTTEQKQLICRILLVNISLSTEETIDTRIRNIWKLRDIYFGDYSDYNRMEALELIFKVLEDREDEDLWKNAREVLTEMLECPDERIWKPAFTRSIESLRDKKKMKNSWRGILEAIMPVRGDKENEEMDRMLVELLSDNDKNIRLGAVLILRELKPRKIDLVRVLQDRLDVEEDAEVKEGIGSALKILKGESVDEYKGEVVSTPVARSSEEIIRISPEDVSSGLQDGQYNDSNGRLKDEFEFIGQFSLSKMQINPIYIYQSKRPMCEAGPLTSRCARPGLAHRKKILVKGGNDYTLMADYIGLRFFKLFGLSVPDASLVRINGKLYLATEYLEGYDEFMFSLPKGLHKDRRIMDGILLSIMLGDNDRKPGNILCGGNDIVHIDFGASLFSRATGGFVPFVPHLHEDELKRVLNVVRLGQKAMANEAYGEAMKEPELLGELARKIGAITNSQIRAIVRSSGIPYREESLKVLDIWIEQLEVEGEKGNWNRKPRSRFTEPIETFRLMKECGGIGEYIEQALINRRNDIVRIFGKYHHLDLHYHTTASDGLKTPADVVKEAKERGLLAVGITDHNTFSGWNEAIEAGDELGVEVIPGVEIDTYDDELGIDNFHLLVYFPKDSVREILDSDFSVIDEIKKVFESDRDKNLEMKAKAGKNGIPVSKVIEFAMRFGGVVVLAHPFEMLDLDKIKKVLAKYPQIKGIEVYSSKHKKEEVEALRQLIGRDYLVTCGTDCHNEEGRGLEMAIGQVSEEYPQGNIPYNVAGYRVVERLRDRFGPVITGKRIAVIGTGYVGLVHGAVLSSPDMGNKVTCVDILEEKVNTLKSGKISIYEPGLEDVVSKGVKTKRLDFTTDIKSSIEENEVIFIAVGTPQKETGEADLSYIEAVAHSIGRFIDKYKVIVIKSTIPPGTHRLVREIIKEEIKNRGLDIDFDIVVNPEFLREGSAVRDTIETDRLVLGVENERAQKIMEELYKPWIEKGTPVFVTDPVSAMLIKYGSNCLLASEVSFIGEIAMLSFLLGGDIVEISGRMREDLRIGKKAFITAGIGYGGSCFPKDVSALIQIGKQYGVRLSVVEAVQEFNKWIRNWFAEKVETEVGGLDGKTVAVLGLAFKENTDDVRDSPALDIVRYLVSKGATVKVYDPIAMENAKKVLPSGVVYTDNPYSCAEGVDAIVIATRWSEFKGLNLERVKGLVRQPFIFDGKNVFNLDDMGRRGFRYFSIGRPNGLSNAENVNNRLTGYGINAFLAMQIAFIGQLALLCEKLGGNIDDVVKGIKFDKRIGQDSLLEEGIGYKGSYLFGSVDRLVEISNAQDFKPPVLDATGDFNKGVVSIRKWLEGMAIGDWDIWQRYKAIGFAKKINKSFEIIRNIKEPLKVSIVIPTHGGQRFLPKTSDNPYGEDSLRKKIAQLELCRLANPLFSWELVVVDDGSPGNRTGKLVKKLWEEIIGEYAQRGIKLDEEQVVILYLAPEEKQRLKSKKGGAVHLGMGYAVSKTSEHKPSDAVFFTDVDISTDLRQVGLLLEPILFYEYSIAIGSRWLPDSIAEDVSFISRLSSKVYNLVVRLILPIGKIKDTQRGFKAFRRDVLERILPYAFDKGLSFDTELLLLGKLSGSEIAEIPIAWFESQSGASSVKLRRDVIPMLKGAWRQRRHLGKDYSVQKVLRQNRIIREIDSLPIKGLIYAFDIDGVLAKRNSPIDKEIARMLVELLKKGLKIRIVTGKSREELEEIGTFGPLVSELRGIDRLDFLEDLIIYTSDGAGKFKMTKDGGFVEALEYDYRFTESEAKVIEEVVREVADELDREYKLSQIGVKPYIRNFGNLKFNFSPYGRGKEQYDKEKFPKRMTRQEIADLVFSKLQHRGITNIRYEISGASTIGFVRIDVSKENAIIDILKEGKILYFGDEVAVGNDQIVGQLAKKEEGIYVISLDPSFEEVPEDVIWWGGKQNGTKAVLRRIIWVINGIKEGPKVVSIGGGNGPMRLAKGMTDFTTNTTNIITVFDNGGSTGSLRDFLDTPAIGDLRNRLSALLEFVPHGVVLKAIFEHRLKKGIDELREVVNVKEKELGLALEPYIRNEIQGSINYFITNVRGRSSHIFDGLCVGNTIITGLYFKMGDLLKAMEYLTRLLEVDSYAKILPVSNANLDIAGEFEDGSIIYGEHQIAHCSDPDKRIKRLFFVKRGTKKRVEPPIAEQGVIDSIKNADAIVIGPGSLYTSCIPNLMVKGVGEAMRDSRGIKVLVVNLLEYNEREKVWETKGYKASDIVREAQKVCNIDCVLVNNHGDRKGYIPVDMEELNTLGVSVVVRDLEDPENPGYHHSRKIAGAIMDILKSHRMNKTYKEMFESEGGYTIDEYAEEFSISVDAAQKELDEMSSIEQESGKGQFHGIEMVKTRDGGFVYRRFNPQRYEDAFRTYDVRAIIDPELRGGGEGVIISDKAFYYMILAYVFLLKEKYENEGLPVDNLNLAVGHDIRVSSERLRYVVIKALSDCGVNVIDIGLTTTPITYFASLYYNGITGKGTDGAIMITASHNPPCYNGFKPVFGSRDGTYNASSEDIKSSNDGHDLWNLFIKIESILLKDVRGRAFDFKCARPGLAHLSERKGWYKKADTEELVSGYKEMVKANVTVGPAQWTRWVKRFGIKEAIKIAREENKKHKPLKGLKIVVDPLYGATGMIAREIFEELGAETRLLHSPPNGLFPDVNPDPVEPENLDSAYKELLRWDGDVVIGFDNDGDRIGAVANVNGERFNLQGDHILAAILPAVLKEFPGCRVIYDVKCSDLLKEQIIHCGGVPVEYMTGHANIKAMMREINREYGGFQFGGEQSGHIYPGWFGENGFFDDSLQAAVLLLNRISREKNRVEGLLEGLPRYYVTMDIRLSYTKELLDKVGGSLKEAKKKVGEIARDYFRGYRFSEIDGLKIYFTRNNREIGWGLIRFSGTEPLISSRVDAVREEDFRYIMSQIYGFLSAMGFVGPDEKELEKYRDELRDIDLWKRDAMAYKEESYTLLNRFPINKTVFRIDLDGFIDDEVIDKLYKIMACGIKISFCTKRGLQEALPIINLLISRLNGEGKGYLLDGISLYTEGTDKKFIYAHGEFINVPVMRGEEKLIVYPVSEDGDLAGFLERLYAHINTLPEPEKPWLNPDLFKMDIRGLADTFLTDEVVEILGKTYGTFLRSKFPKKEGLKIVIGRDNRDSSLRISSAFVKGVVSTGVSVVDIGLAPSFVLYRMLGEVDGGIYVTGGHLGNEYNGLKLFLNTNQFSKMQIEELGWIVQKGNFSVGNGSYKDVDLFETCLQELKALYQNELGGELPLKGLRIGLDCAGGPSGFLIPRLLERLGASVCEVDGKHKGQPDLLEPKDYAQLREKIKTYNLDLGILISWDGGALGVVDNQGNIVSGNDLILIILQDMFSGKKGKISFIGASTISRDVAKFMVRYKKRGNFIYAYKAYNKIKDVILKIKKRKAQKGEDVFVWGGDERGHLLFPPYYLPDVSLTLLHILKVLVGKGKTLASIKGEISQRRYISSPEIRIPIVEYRLGDLGKVQGDIIVRISKEFKGPDYKVLPLDGLRIRFIDPAGCAVIRASFTVPEIVINTEGFNYLNLYKILNHLRNILKEYTELSLWELDEYLDKGIYKDLLNRLRYLHSDTVPIELGYYPHVEPLYDEALRTYLQLLKMAPSENVLLKAWEIVTAYQKYWLGDIKSDGRREMLEFREAEVVRLQQKMLNKIRKVKDFTPEEVAIEIDNNIKFYSLYTIGKEKIVVFNICPKPNGGALFRAAPAKVTTYAGLTPGTGPHGEITYNYEGVSEVKTSLPGNGFIRGSISGYSEEEGGFIRLDPPLEDSAIGAFLKRKLEKKELTVEDYTKYEFLILGEFIDVIKFLAESINYKKELLIYDSVKEIFRRYGYDIPSSVSLGEFLRLIEAGPKIVSREGEVVSEEKVRYPVTVQNPRGLHIRVALAIEEVVKKAGVVARICKGDRVADASITEELLKLTVEYGQTVIVEVSGKDALSVAMSIEEILTDTSILSPKTSGIRMQGAGEVVVLASGTLDETVEWLKGRYPGSGYGDRFRQVFNRALALKEFTGLRGMDLRLRFVDGNENLLHTEGNTVVIDIDIFDGGRGIFDFEPILYAELVAEEFRHLAWDTKGYNIPVALEEIITDYLKLRLISLYTDSELVEVLLALMLDNDIDDQEFFMSVGRVLSRDRLSNIIGILKNRVGVLEEDISHKIGRLEEILGRQPDVVSYTMMINEAVRYAGKEGVYGTHVRDYLRARSFEQIVSGVKKWLVKLGDEWNNRLMEGEKTHPAEIEYRELLEILEIIVPDNPELARRAAGWHINKDGGTKRELGEEERRVVELLESILALFNDIDEMTRDSITGETHRIKVVRTIKGPRIFGRVSERVRKLIAYIDRYRKVDLPDGVDFTEPRYIVVDRDRRREELKAVEDELKKYNIHVVSEIPQGKDFVVLVDPSDIGKWEGKTMDYLPLPYMEVSLKMAALMVLSNNKVEEGSPIYNFVKEFYEILLNRPLSVTETLDLFKTPWWVLPEIKYLGKDLDILRDAITLLGRYA